ncbi:MAG: hypothetical protein GX640_12075, partial [Fibrobacter sp.]|nr:hypothetical protein [Fibrobacter sp.]
MLKISAIIGGVVVCLMVLVAYMAGIFDTVTFTHTEVGPYNLIYREHRGQYAGIRFLMNDVFKHVISSQKKVKIQYGFAIFYDDPSKVPQDSLRCITGVITDSIVQTTKPYKSATFKRTDALITEFPVRSPLSYTTGYYKYY